MTDRLRSPFSLRTSFAAGLSFAPKPGPLKHAFNTYDFSARRRIVTALFNLRCDLPTASNPLRQRDINERIAEIDGSTGSPQAATVTAMQANPLSEQQVANGLNNLDTVWDELFPAEQARIVSLLIERVVISETGAEVVMRLRQGYDGPVRSDGLHSLVDELDSREERIGADG